ncbi:uncharacterized protein CIMG_13233 [Coccidioides immitis RS]|uniref:Uncharacterized protein n=1 Tax=Coccidioides immitis (strain RS) TaxID=246410 RepID=J3K5B3_COCIM|nr:uncharacterized protein CIMG_13233 [Coccidioides immitis RS]EAS29605.3 hypothetical protein CIMG_13233 [Coccidioides immitis RS]
MLCPSGCKITSCLLSFFSLSHDFSSLFSLERTLIPPFIEDIGPLSIIASFSFSSSLVVAASSLPAQAGLAALPLLSAVIAPALARNIVVAVPPALAEFIIFTQLPPAGTFTGVLQTNSVVLPGLPPHTGAQALSAHKRVWCHKPIQRSMLIAGLNNSNQLTVHA